VAVENHVAALSDRALALFCSSLLVTCFLSMCARSCGPRGLLAL
jgi:hypothetical protein